MWHAWSQHSKVTYMNASIISIIAFIHNIHSLHEPKKRRLSIVRLPNIVKNMIDEIRTSYHPQSTNCIRWLRVARSLETCEPKHSEIIRAKWYCVAKNTSNRSTMKWKELSNFVLLKIPELSHIVLPKSKSDELIDFVMLKICTTKT
jgi:hypothetical protein